MSEGKCGGACGSPCGGTRCHGVLVQSFWLQNNKAVGRYYVHPCSESCIPGFGPSFGGQWLVVTRRRLLPPFSEDPGLQPVEIDVDDRRRIERENLRQGQTADDGITERLANLRADPRTHHHRYATEQRRHRGHQDRPEAHEASLVDRFFGCQAFAVLDLLGKIDQHDAVLLDDADEQYGADDRDHAQIAHGHHRFDWLYVTAFASPATHRHPMRMGRGNYAPSAVT